MDMERVNVADIPAPVPPRRKKRPNSGKPMVGEGKENTLSDSISKSSKKPRIESKMKDEAILEIERRVQQEEKIKEGAVKLLQASKSPQQVMEASKGVFVSNARILSLMKELQKRKMKNSDEKQKTESSAELSPAKAQIAISEIRIPLEWREFESIRGKPDHSKHWVFCLFKLGSQVMDTPTLVEVDRFTMDISFQNIVIFPEREDPDFVLEIEVYSSVQPEEHVNKASTPIKMLRRLKEKIEDSPGCATPHSPYLPHTSSITPTQRFVLAGHAQLTLEDVVGSCRTYVLKKGGVGASGTAATSGRDQPILPLWGQVCCRLMAQLDCATEPRTTGFITVQRMVGGLPEWKRLWCVFRQHHLRCWNYPEDVGRKMPVLTLDLTENMKVEPAPRLTMRRPNTLLIKDQSPSIPDTFLGFESREERDSWMQVIQQAILDHRVWKDSCEFIIPTPASKFYTASPAKEPVGPPTEHPKSPLKTPRPHKPAPLPPRSKAVPPKKPRRPASMPFPLEDSPTETVL